MTREEIERLEGRELDAAVHGRVFGRRVKWAAPSAELLGLIGGEHSAE